MCQCWGSSHVLTMDILGQITCVWGDAFYMVGYFIAFFHNPVHTDSTPTPKNIHTKERNKDREGELEKERERLKHREI